MPAQPGYPRYQPWPGMPSLIPPSTVPPGTTPPGTTPPGTTPPGTTPPGTTPGTTSPNTTDTTTNANQTADTSPSLGGQGDVATSGGGAGVGAYLDSAIPRTMFRLRFDAGFDMNRPDRSEFFYVAWRELSFHTHAIRGDGAYFDPKARGPEQLPGKLDYQEISSYMEFALGNRFSAFVEVPYRFVHYRNIQEDPERADPVNGMFFPEPEGGAVDRIGATNDNPNGISDIVAGFKFAFIADCDRYLTFQFRVFTPTGDAGKGLGTGHVSLEPGILYYQRLNDRLVLEAQFKDWIPINGGHSVLDGTEFDGNILIYGVGLGYDVYQSNNLRITPVTEFVGWTVLSGLQSFAGVITPPRATLPNSHGVESGETTIINAKLGVRTYFGCSQDIYIGWGHALTGERWYRDMARVEYRFRF